jgi:type II secretory ATPase GspE/PulE/Tfp pilus assembly ATPase PilB-like protein
VEFDVPGVSQIEINPVEDIKDDDEMTQNFNRSKDFAMRSAPDIILV